ncbi:MAG TPA: hypothetical protein VFG59_01085 [Anaeromyxobacter sp.]|nr:hypothetical protein [Anaeromyxobacter sp.]
MLASLLALSLAASPRIAVLPIVAGEGVSEKTAAALTEALAAEVRKRAGGEVITQREINTVLSLERQKAMMGCASDACMAELGGALGVEQLVNGDIARVGESLLVHYRLIEVGKVRVVAQADRRLRKGTLDDLLDLLPAMTGELFAATPPPPPERRAQAESEEGGRIGTAPGPTPAPERKLPPPWAEEPDRKANPGAVAKLVLWEDGSGNYVAFDPVDLDAPGYAGTARKMHRLRVGSGFLDGGQGTGSHSFWDPRVGGGRFEWTPAEAKLSCGQRELPLKRVPAVEAQKILARAELLAPRWRRVPHLLARDDEGTYFLVDGARDAEGDPADPPDYRLYVGKKGGLSRIDLLDSIKDSGGLVFITSGGRLVARQQGRKYAVEWSAGNTRIALTWLEPAEQGPLIYRELGVYAGQSLGTPCDGRL